MRSLLRFVPPGISLCCTHPCEGGGGGFLPRPAISASTSREENRTAGLKAANPFVGLSFDLGEGGSGPSPLPESRLPDPGSGGDGYSDGGEASLRYTAVRAAAPGSSLYHRTPDGHGYYWLI